MNRINFATDMRSVDRRPIRITFDTDQKVVHSSVNGTLKYELCVIRVTFGSFAKRIRSDTVNRINFAPDIGSADRRPIRITFDTDQKVHVFRITSGSFAKRIRRDTANRINFATDIGIVDRRPIRITFDTDQKVVHSSVNGAI